MNNNQSTTAIVSITTPPPSPCSPNSLKKRWYDFLSPWWRVVSNFSSVSNLGTFSEHIACAGLEPEEIKDWPSFLLTASTNMTIQDASTLRYAFKCRELLDKVNEKRRAEGKIPVKILSSDSPEGRRQSAFNEGGVFSIEEIADPIGQKISKKIEDLDFSEKPIVSRDEKSGKVDFVETILCSAGPIETINVEQGIHSILTIPEAIIMSTASSSIRNMIQFAVENSKIDPSKRVRPQITLIATANTSIISYYLNIFAFVISIIHIVLCSFARLTDRSAAHYLTIPKAIRFLDVGLVIFCSVFLEPLSIVLESYGVSIYDRYNAIFYTMVPTMAIMLLFASFSIFFLPIREKNAYDPFPNHFEIENQFYDGINNNNCCSSSRIASPNDNNNKASIPRRIKHHCKSFYNRFFKSKVDKYIFFKNDVKEIEYIGYIGRWRKWMLSKKFRDSVFDISASE